MIRITDSSGNVRQRIAFYPPRVGAAVRLSARGVDSAGLPGGVGGEQRADAMTAWIAAEAGV